MSRTRPIALTAALGLTVALFTHPGAAVVPTRAVALDSAIFVERSSDAQRVLERPGQLRRGDRVVTIMTWRRALPGGQFTLVNPLPARLQYQGSADGREEISVDGGRTWGKLGDLRIGTRLATPEDVTHLRWHVATPAPEGRIAYSAIVR